MLQTVGTKCLAIFNCNIKKDQSGLKVTYCALGIQVSWWKNQRRIHGKTTTWDESYIF